MPPRASSGMLRSRIRPSAGTAPLRSTQIRADSDLGGPGGQQPPPPNPGGPEAIKRNWAPFAGAALLASGAFAYLSRPGEKKPDLAAVKNSDVAKKAGEAARKVEQEAAKPLGEMGGKKGQLGGFRSE